MSKFKVTNPDEPIEIDLYQDIPSKDPDTGIDQIDDKGNILVKRYVTRSINSKGIANIKNALPQINTNKEAIAELDRYAKDSVASITSDIGSINDNLLGTQTDLSDLIQTVSVLQGKINGIQGIDIDVVQADVDALKKSAYLITGGVLKGDVSIQTPNTAVLTLTPSGSSSYASFSTNNDVLDCTTTWGKVFKVSEEGKYFYGLADKATQDALGQNIADNYIKDITGANATLTITKGTGTTSILSINNVLQAQKAIADKNNNDITTTYATKVENTSNLASAKAYADTKKNEAITSANSYTDQEKAKYLPLLGGILSGSIEARGSIYEVSVGAYNNTQGSIYLFSHATGRGMFCQTADRTTGYLIISLGQESATFIGNLQGNAATATHATTADRAYPRIAGGGDINFHWEGRDGQPTWLWGGEDGINMYVYNPSNFAVNHAIGANEATNAYNLRTNSHDDHFVRSEWDGSYFWTWVRAPDGGYRPVRVERANSAGYADNAGTASRSTNNGSFFISGYEISIG